MVVVRIHDDKDGDDISSGDNVVEDDRGEIVVSFTALRLLRKKETRMSIIDASDEQQQR